MPLSAFTRIETTTAPLAVNHQGQFPAVTVSFNLAPGASLGRGREGHPDGAAGEIGAAARACTAELPGHGRRPSRPRSRNEPFLILAALITVYIVLGVLYESYIHPITILSTLPSAASARCSR